MNRFAYSMYRLALVAIVLATAAPRADAAKEQLIPAETYQGMSVFERAQYDKANKLHAKRQYRLAAPEFEKFVLQFEDSVGMPYAMFMRARCLHADNKRNTAVKIYSEVLDYFPDYTPVAAPALYYRGQAHMANGEMLKGLQSHRELAEHERHSKHELVAGALNSMAAYYWSHEKPEVAVKYWKQVHRDFCKSNRSEGHRARYNVMRWYVYNSQFKECESWTMGFYEPNPRRTAEQTELDKAHTRLDLIDDMRRSLTSSHLAGLTDFNVAMDKDKAAKAMADLYAYAVERKGEYFKLGRAFGYRQHSRTVALTQHIRGYFNVARETLPRTPDYQKRFLALRKEAIDFAAKIETPADRDAVMAHMILNWGYDKDQAFGMLGRIADPQKRRAVKLSLLWSQQYAQEYLAEMDVEEAKAKTIPDTQARAAKVAWIRRQRAYVYHRWTREYEKAIKLYYEMNSPPGTLYEIANCYAAMGKMPNQLQVLGEIEGSFPDRASDAAWKIAQVYSGKKMATQAKAVCWRILKMYPKSREASQAHQRLESYGVDTGGGVLDDG